MQNRTQTNENMRGPQVSLFTDHQQLCYISKLISFVMKIIKLENNSKQKLLHQILGPHRTGSRMQPCFLHIQIHADSECTLILCKLKCSVWGFPYICPYASHMYSTCSTQTTFLLPLSLPLSPSVLCFMDVSFLLWSFPDALTRSVTAILHLRITSLFSICLVFQEKCLNIFKGKLKWKNHLEDHN